jgi:hypothetical protein
MKKKEKEKLARAQLWGNRPHKSYRRAAHFLSLFFSFHTHFIWMQNSKYSDLSTIHEGMPFSPIYSIGADSKKA